MWLRVAVYLVFCTLRCWTDEHNIPFDDPGTVTQPLGLLYPLSTESREVRSLDGVWNFFKSDVDDPLQGVREAWYTNDLDKIKPTIPISVPATFNDATTTQQLRDHIGTVWYERKFFVPQTWGSDQLVWLRFGSVQYKASVWLNGKQVVTHEIGHLPFEVDVTQYVKHGVENRLTVLADNTVFKPAFTQLAARSASLDPMFEQTVNLDFFDYAALHNSVYLYKTPKIYIADVKVTTELKTDNVGYVFYTITTNKPPSYPVYVEARLHNKVGEIVAQQQAQTKLNGRLKVTDVRPWWPHLMHSEPGYVYTLEIFLHVADTSQLDVYRLKVGVRTLQWNNSTLLLNDKPIYLRGFGRPEESDKRGRGLDFDLLASDLNFLKWMGANAYHASHYTYSEESLQFADEHGIMIIDECPSINMGIFEPMLLEKHKSVMKQLMLRDRNHPSVIMWSVVNEPHSTSSQAGVYFGRLTNYTRTLDSSRPITAAINADVKNDKLAQYLDVISFNRYESWNQNPGYLDMITNSVVDEASAWQRLHNKPVIMTQYHANAVNGLDFKNFVSSESYEVALTSKLFRAFENLRQQNWFVGELVWNFADFRLSQNFTSMGGNKKSISACYQQQHAKPAAYFLRERFLVLAEVDGDLDHIEMPKQDYAKLQFFRSGILLTVRMQNVMILSARFNKESFNGDLTNGGIYGKTIHAAEVPNGSPFKIGICRPDFAYLAPGTTIYVWFNIVDENGVGMDSYVDYVVPANGVDPDSPDLIKVCSIPLNDRIEYFKSGILLTLNMENVKILTARFNKKSFNADISNGGIYGKSIHATNMPSGAPFIFGVCTRDFANLASGSTIYVWYNIIDSQGVATDQYVEYVVPAKGLQTDSDELVSTCFLQLNEKMEFYKGAFKLTIPKQAKLKQLTVRASRSNFNYNLRAPVDYGETKSAIAVAALESYQFYACVPLFQNLPIGSTIYIWYNVVKNDNKDFDQYKEYVVNEVLPNSADVKKACRIPF